MSYQTNKYEVGTVLTYMGNRYSILEAFGTYPELTADVYRSLPENDRKNRIEAFYDKLNSDLNTNIRALILQGQEATRFNLDACPVDTYYKITPTTNHGTAQTSDGKEIYKAGHPVHLSTQPYDIKRIFEGWYVDGEVAHTQPDWFFYATKDLAPQARYSDIVYLHIEINADEHSEISIFGETGWVKRIEKHVTIGDNIKVSAQVDSGYEVSCWQDALGNIVGYGETCTIVANQDENKNKIYLKTVAVVQVKKNPVCITTEVEGGSIRSISASTSAGNVCSPTGLRVEVNIWSELLGHYQKIFVDIPKEQSSGSTATMVLHDMLDANIESVVFYPDSDSCYQYVYEPS